ncbi:MAG: MBL fold metallo-hydrolase [Candidatus Eisenbacteria bacterium]
MTGGGGGIEAAARTRMGAGIMWCYSVKSRLAGFALLVGLLALGGCAERNTAIYLPDTTAPEVSALAESGGTITWETDENSNCVLLYGQKAGIYDHYGYNVVDGGLSHHVDLIDVGSGRYYFRVMARDDAGNQTISEESSTELPVSHTPVAEPFVYTMIDVGWGDCHFLEFPSGTTVMIDAGSDSASHRANVIDFLETRGITPPAGITYMIGTHAHGDHLGGFPGSLVVFYHAAVFLAPELASVSVFQYLKKPLDEAGLTERYGLRAGQTNEDTDFLKWDEEHGVRVKVMSAGAGRFFSPDNSGDSVNCDSAVLKVSYGRVDFLFTGDAEEFAEDLMIKDYGAELACEVLKVAHHGNDDATSNLFLEWVRPRVGFISNSLVDNDGVFKQSVIDLLKSFGVNYYVTDRTYMDAARTAVPEYGNVTVTTDGETFVVSSWK